MKTKNIGTLGEKLARKYLKNKGYKIIDKNYCFRIPGNPQKGEIDIIAKKKDIFSFIEVKTIKINSLLKDASFLPEDKVNYKKRRKIAKTAEYWLIKNKIPLNSKWQIDIIAITICRAEKKIKISHFKNI